MSFSSQQRLTKLLSHLNNNNTGLKSTRTEINNGQFISHHSWNLLNKDKIDSQIDIDDIIMSLHSKFGNKIPEYTVNDSFDLTSDKLQNELYNKFYNESGCLIIRNIYSKQLMNDYNKWCEEFLEIAKKTDGNIRHPKQKGKYLINDVMFRLSKDNPDLLLKLINNSNITKLCDILLGFFKFGACTTHWIEPGGERQLSHVDYPMHVGSGPFWENNIYKLMSQVTKYQINNILPFYSIQILIASDSMSEYNGSTQLIPSSNLISNMDLIVHNKIIYNKLEKYFINCSLNAGDILIFNRRICHRGGKNSSNKRRNSLILQCVWLWALGQEIMDINNVTKHLKNSKIWNNYNKKEKQTFLLRLKAPYPANIKKAT